MPDFERFKPFARGGNKKPSEASRRAIIYSRVSSAEQVENFSLASQREAILACAAKEGLEVVREFGNMGESAKTGAIRKEFHKMLAYARNKSHKVETIIFFNYDRFSREGAQAIIYKEELRKLGIKILSASTPIDTSTPIGETFENLQLLLGKLDNDTRIARTKQGMKKRLLSGLWTGTAPFGYSNVNKRVEVNPRTAPLVVELFRRKAADPNVSMKALRTWLKQQGHDNIGHNMINRLLKNPFYCGLMIHASLEGKIVKGQHKPLITEERFLVVNGILAKNPKGFKHGQDGHIHPLKGFTKCSTCGQPMTAYIVKSKEGKARKTPHRYYKCRQTGCKNNISSLKLEATFLKELTRYEVPKDLLPLITKEVIAIVHEQTQFNERLIKNQEKKLKAVEKKLKTIRRRFVLSEITLDDKKEFGSELETEKNQILLDLEQAQKISSNTLKGIKLVLQNASNMAILWSKGDFVTKRQVQQICFPEGITFNKKTGEVRTPRVNSILAINASISNIMIQPRAQNEAKGKSTKKAPKSKGISGPESSNNVLKSLRLSSDNDSHGDTGELIPPAQRPGMSNSCIP